MEDINYKEMISFKRLKEVIQERGLKIKDVAVLCEKDPTNISGLISGFSLPKTDFMAKLCFVLKVSIDEICVFKGIEPTQYQKEWFEKTGVLYKPEEDAVGEVTYRPLRRLLELYLEEQNKGRAELLTADDFFDKVTSARRRTGAFDKSNKGIEAALKARGRELGIKTSSREYRDYSKGLPYPTRVKLRQDKPLNIRQIYDICKVLGCTPSHVMSYK